MDLNKFKESYFRVINEDIITEEADLSPFDVVDIITLVDEFKNLSDTEEEILKNIVGTQKNPKIGYTPRSAVVINGNEIYILDRETGEEQAAYRLVNQY